MKLIFRLSLRNLMRQRRRNLLLGIGIALGMMILVITNSFSHGLVDVLINDIASYAFGHLVVQGDPGLYYTMIRDKGRIEGIIRDTVPEDDLLSINENLGVMAQAVGNNEADNIMVIGVDAGKEEVRDEFFNDFFTLVEGDFNDYFNEEIENPIIISETKASSLNVGVNDVVKVRFPTVNGQMQSARLTVIAVANASNSFMDIVTFLDARRVKELAGYKPWESASLQLTLNNPKTNAKKYADQLHEKLQPGIIAIKGSASGKDAHLLAFKNNGKGKDGIQDLIELVSGSEKEAFASGGVMISSQLASELGLGVGDVIKYTYQTKYRGDYSEEFTVDAVYQSDSPLGNSVILVNEERIYDSYNNYLPAANDRDFIKRGSSLYSSLAAEWKLLERSSNNQELQKKYKEQRKISTDQSIFDVVTMYEGASQIMQLEGVLNLITLVAVMILFFIILIGVVNTLRMTIKERTREIGTVRAIGMQKKDIRNQFLMETVLLTFFACLLGIAAGIIVMYGLGALEMNMDNALSMILKDGHLNFKLNPGSIGINFILILFIALLTAYFPARRASRMAAVDALRHYE